MQNNFQVTETNIIYLHAETKNCWVIFNYKKFEKELDFYVITYIHIIN